MVVVAFVAWTMWSGRPPAKIPATVPISDTYGRLPLSFEANRGQTDARVKFLARGNGYALFLAPTEAVLKLRAPASSRHEKKIGPDSSSAIRIKLKDANPASAISGIGELAGKSSYFIGRDPKRWRTNVPTYAGVRVANVYRGIDVMYRGVQGRLEYDLDVSPGADPTRIKLQIEGARALRFDASRNLVIDTPAGEVIERAPQIYQIIRGKKRIVAGGYVLADAHTVAFRLGAYDNRLPLTIDPLLTYTSYLGGTGGDEGVAIAVDQNDGSAWVTGTTASTDFPVTANALQSTNFGSDDIFMTKISPDGSSIEYSTYAGGGLDDEATGIAVDPEGNAYATGLTLSQDFPVSEGAYQTALSGTQDAFVIAIDPNGGLIYSTLLGTAAAGIGIAVDSVGEAFVVGTTRSASFPTTPGVFQVSYPGDIENPLVGFVTKLNSIGTGLIYSSFLGLSDGGWPNAVALDPSNDVYVSGGTSTGVNYNMQSCAPFLCGFVVELDSNGAGPNFSDIFPFATLYGIATDSNGDAHVIGTRGGPLLINLDASGNATDVMLSLGGNPNRIAIGPGDNFFLSGITDSSSLAVTPGAYQATYGGAGDAFVSVLDPTGNFNLYTTYLGGSGLDLAQGVAVDSNSNAYVTGTTQSQDFPTTAGVFEGQHPSGNNGLAFVARIVPVLQSPPATMTPTPSQIATPVPTIFVPPTPTMQRSPLPTRTGGQTPIGTSTPTTVQTPAPTAITTPPPTILGGLTPTPTATATATATQTPTPSSTPTPVGTVKIAPVGIHFDKIKVGKSSGLHAITITNPRVNKSAVIITEIALQSQISELAPTGFAIQSAKSTCTVGGELALGKACRIYLSFTPQGVGPAIDNVLISGNFENSGQRVALAGTGR
jgi:hypothetical protein